MKYFSLLILLLLFLIFPATISAASLADYWNGNAKWKLHHKLTLTNTGWEYGYSAGNHIIVKDNVWYLFHRKNNVSSDYAHCNNQELAFGTQVRSSTDKGKTWGQPIDIVTPQANTPWSCAATDGDIFFQPSTNTWHFLFQCQNGDFNWKGCYATRVADDPLGAFQVNPQPVVNSGDLWNQICNQPSDDCVSLAQPNNTKEEGTYNIITYQNGYYYVSFHGFDGTNGYRGLAKTTDFINWQTTGTDLPSDAIFDHQDAQNWREDWQGDSIGGGAAKTIYQDGYYYMVIEAADTTLFCQDGQKWDVGILRTNNLSSSNYQQLPAGNPIIYSSLEAERNGQSIGCNPAYANLFIDGSEVYLHVSRETYDNNNSGIFIYKLEPKTNLLTNADFWKCSTENWQAEGSAFSVQRRPNYSSDGLCYASISCNGQCSQPNTFSQTVSVQPNTQAQLSLLAASSQASDILQVQAQMLNASGQQIDNQNFTIENLTSDYQDFSFSLNIGDLVNQVRVSLVPQTATALRIDQINLETNHVCIADLNQDNVVNLIDYATFVSEFINQPANPVSDLNNDSMLNLFDYAIFVSNFGHSC